MDTGTRGMLVWGRRMEKTA